MQLEDTDGSNDVPPLSCRGIVTSSRFVEKNTAQHIRSGKRINKPAFVWSSANQGVLV